MTDWLRAEWPAPPGVHTLVTTRSGGVSEDRYGSMNLGGHVGDDPGHVAENRRRLRQHLPVEPLWLDQVHGVAVADAATAIAGTRADAAIARRPGGVCAVLTADCLPILLCDGAGKVVAAVHAGWRGLAGGVIEATLAAMAVAPDGLLAYLGPAIGARSYEVGEEVRRVFVDADPGAAGAFAGNAAGRWWCDLYALARRRLALAGVASVWGGGFDTAAEPERFYSYRRDGITGRMATLIWRE